MEVVRHLRRLLDTAQDRSVGQLVVVAFFFAMRSCEYSDVESPCRRTTLVQVRDVTFWKEQGSKRVQRDHTDDIRNADAVSITFRKQKNRNDGTAITQHVYLSLDNDKLCPVRARGKIIGRIRGCPATTIADWKETTINAFPQEDKAGLTPGMTSKTVLQKLRLAVAKIGGGTGWDTTLIRWEHPPSGQAQPWPCSWPEYRLKQYN